MVCEIQRCDCRATLLAPVFSAETRHSGPLHCRVHACLQMALGLHRTRTFQDTPVVDTYEHFCWVWLKACAHVQPDVPPGSPNGPVGDTSSSTFLAGT